MSSSQIYPFSHNHGSVENYPKKNERKIILKIHPFSTFMVMGGRVMVANFYLIVVFQMGVHHPKKGIEVHLHHNKKCKKPSTAASHHIKHG